jgi:hypothetical protein
LFATSSAEEQASPFERAVTKSEKVQEKSSPEGKDVFELWGRRVFFCFFIFRVV